MAIPDDVKLPITLHGFNSISINVQVKIERAIEQLLKEIASEPGLKNTNDEIISAEILNGIYAALKHSVTRENIAAYFLLERDPEEYKRTHEIGYKSKE